ncbi:MAG: alpha-ketoglutarate-dependent dioxygenase AlkB [Pseudomonadota bacterium]
MDKSSTNSQASLFKPEYEHMLLDKGELRYYEAWLSQDEAQQLFINLRQSIEWEQSVINMYGRAVKIPRLNAWYGDDNCPYRYSGHQFFAKPWLTELLTIKQRIESVGSLTFNSVLANCYRSGQDSVAWHSDDEPELGKNPVVACLSLGAERQFQLRHRYQKQLPVQKLTLKTGSLLIMSGAIQHYWHHQVPKTAKKVGERLSLTYRQVKSI